MNHSSFPKHVFHRLSRSIQIGIVEFGGENVVLLNMNCDTMDCYKNKGAQQEIAVTEIGNAEQNDYKLVSCILSFLIIYR